MTDKQQASLAVKFSNKETCFKPTTWRGMQITSTNQMIWEIECLKKWCPIMEGDEI